MRLDFHRDDPFSHCRNGKDVVPLIKQIIGGETPSLSGEGEAKSESTIEL
jgi:hypothetical protein